MNKKFTLLYRELVSNETYSRAIFWSTTFVTFILILDLVEISNGNSYFAFFAVLKTLYITVGTILVLEFRKPKPELELIRLPTW